MKTNKKKKSKNLIYKMLSILLITISSVFIGILFYTDLLPTKYLILIISIVLIFNLFNVFLINLKKLKKKVKKTLAIFMTIVILVLLTIIFYFTKTLGVLVNNGDSKYKLENYSVIVLKDSSYNELKDIRDEKVGYFKNSKGAEKANKRISEEVAIVFESYDSSDSLVNDLLDSKINVILIEDSIKNIMEEEIENFTDMIKVIYTFNVRIKSESTLKEVDVTKEPFSVYISGIDTYGEISSVSRSDVNIVMVVNPKINQILLISIPRDYYVQLHGTTGVKDKLTHAGIYGIDMSIQTIEDLLDMDINYYVKVNFTSVIDIVDALDGLDVYSKYSFISYSGFKFKEGMNYVNGEQALDFARTRKAFKDGDRQRGKNQQAVIEALIRKATNKSIITKYNSLLNAVNGKYQTNMGIKKITSLIKMQLDNMPNWTVTSYSLSGYDASDYTYTYNQLLYVMKPDEDSVAEAIKLVDQILNDGELENSYHNISGNSNKVTKVYNNPAPSENQQNSIKVPQEDITKNDDEEEVVEEDVDEQNNEEDINNDADIENADVDPIESIIPQPDSDQDLTDDNS